MAIPISLSLAIIVVTIFIHGLGTAAWINNLTRRHDFKSQVFSFVKSLRILSVTAVVLMMLHYIEIAVWAGVYMLIPELDKLSHWE